MLIAVNCIPLWGVFFAGWNAKEVFLVYSLETIMIGIFTLLKMFIITQIRKEDEFNKGSKPVSGYFFMLFFFFHYGFFVGIQLFIFLEAAKIQPDITVWNFVTGFWNYLSDNGKGLLISFFLSYTFLFIKEFLFKQQYKRQTLGYTMFQPYPRIFVQQFTVILGTFFLTIGAGKGIVVVFVLAKIFFEVWIDFDSILKKNEKTMQEG